MAEASEDGVKTSGGLDHPEDMNAGVGVVEAPREGYGKRMLVGGRLQDVERYEQNQADYERTEREAQERAAEAYSYEQTADPEFQPTHFIHPGERPSGQNLSSGVVEGGSHEAIAGTSGDKGGRGGGRRSQKSAE